MARKPVRPPGQPWSLARCATNDRVWNLRWDQTRWLKGWARRDELLAINHFGTVQLFDVADAAAVRLLGELAIPGLTGKEDFPLAFHGDYLIQAYERGLHAIDVRDPTSPQLVTTFEGDAPVRREGTFVGDVYYAGSIEGPGLFAQRVTGKDVIAFDLNRSQYSAPAAFARATARHDVLLVLGTGQTEVHKLVDGLPIPGSVAIATKRNDVGASGTVFTTSNGLFAIVTGIAGCGVRVVDVERPTNPKLQSRMFKPEPRGAGLVGDTLLVVDGVYKEYLALTRIALARPKSIASASTMLIEDPELSCGLLVIEERGAELFVLGVTGRFALLRPH